MLMSDFMPIFNGSNLIRLVDGKLGLMVVPSVEREEVGIQVDGEEEIRWAPVSDVIHIGGSAGWHGCFVQYGQKVVLERKTLEMQCTLDFWEGITEDVRRHYFTKKFDDAMREDGMYRASAAEITSTYKQVKEERYKLDVTPHIKIRISADAIATPRRGRKKAS